MERNRARCAKRTANDRTWKREELKLILKAITFVPENVLPMGHPIRNVHITDVNFHFNRRRNYDLINKANFVAQMINLGFNGRHVLKEAEVFPDVEQVWNDSKEIVEAIQQSKISSTTAQKMMKMSIQTKDWQQITVTRFLTVQF